MARLARVEVFAADEIAVVHVMNRTVRRCFLFGEDSVSGKNFDHRKVWIDQQLAHQARYFGIDLLCQAIMSNHFHLVLRSRPDVVKEWSDKDVARRWLMLCPERRDEKRQPLEPTEFEIHSIVKKKDKLATVRSRLSDISWWMRLLSQNIAQRANKEDGEVGKFFQARYRAVRLLDETAILACAAYVDLNPIRAAIAETIEGSDFTSAQKRCSVFGVGFSKNTGEDSADIELRSSLLSEQNMSAAVSSSIVQVPPADLRGNGTRGEDSRTEDRSGYSGRHLAPVGLKGRGGETGPCAHKAGARCSNKGFLPMSTAEYLQLLDWTARQVRSDKQGATPQEFAPLFNLLGISAEIWCRLVKDFGKLFSVVAGRPARIDEHRSKDSSRRYRSRRQTRELLSTV
jgi:hypothetical protein